MKEEIKKILENVQQLWWSRKIINQDHCNYLEHLYPSLPKSSQLFLLMNDLPLPICPSCKKIIQKIGNKTCSTICREQYKKQQGIDSFKKSRETMLEKYGSYNVMKLQKFQDKRISTNIKKYGSKVSNITRKKAKDRADNLNTKGRITLKERYGVDNPSQLPDHAEKCKTTLMENYSVIDYYQSKEWQEKSLKNKFEKLSNILPDSICLLDINNADIDLLSSYANPNKRISFQCNCNMVIESIPEETFKYRIRLYGTPCGQCSNTKGKGSAKEKELVDFLKTIYIGKILENNRSLIAPKEIDIIIPELKICIEFCGLYWHNDLRVDKKYHQEKMNLCNNNGYQLITIFEDEWDHKKKIVMNRLIHKLNLSTSKIYARKCIVKEITSQNAREFINEYHIQGFVGARHYLGLYHFDELISVMSFALSSISKGNANGIELSRFCSKYNVVGGADKLFKYFTRNYNYTEIFSYSDLRWNNGIDSVYEKLGMIKMKSSPINYWYINGNTRIHRFNLRKESHHPKNKTEWSIRRKEGWLRIWDCGHAKYIWKKPRE